MTIIVARGFEMAADTAIWSGNDTIAAHMKKITRLPDGSLVGCAGGPRYCAWFAEWLGQHVSVRPMEWDRSAEPALPDEGFAAIWIKADGTRLRFNGSSLPFEDAGDFSACGGAGVPIAIGALAVGATAHEAVTIAIRLSSAAGGDVQVERIGACGPDGKVWTAAAAVKWSWSTLS